MHPTASILKAANGSAVNRTTGGWIGYVHLAIPTGNRGGYVETRQWCPAHALTKNESAAEA